MWRHTTNEGLVLATIQDLYQPADLDEFPAVVMRTLRRLIPLDIASYTEVNVRRRRAIGILDVPEAAFEGMPELLAAYMDEHPLISYYNRTGDGAAYRITDFTSQRQFEASSIFNNLYKRMEVRRQMAATIQTPRPVIIGAIVNRRKKDFTEPERAILNLLRPHLARAYANAEALTRLREQRNSLELAMEATGCGVVIVDHNCRIQSLTPAASILLDRFFDAPRSAAELPEFLTRFVQSALRIPSAPREHGIERAAMKLSIRLLLNTGHRLHTIVLEPDRSSLPTEPLLEAGLTPREAEVLRWVAHGKTNDQIAQLVGAKIRTVQKHLEHIFKKLNVQSRVTAAERARHFVARNGNGAGT